MTEVTPYFHPDENSPYLAGVEPFVRSSRAPRFVQLHGASGSGKTTLVRSLMESWGPVIDHRLPSYQKQPIAQFLMNAPDRPLCLIGHYYAACGGADTLKSRHVPYLIAKEALDLGYDVLLEGIFLSVEVHRVASLQEAGYDRHSVFLDVPIEWCEESVQLRREAKGSPRRPLKQMEAFHPRIMHTLNRLKAVEVPNLYASSGHNDCPSDSPEREATASRSWALSLVRELLQ